MKEYSIIFLVSFLLCFIFALPYIKFLKKRQYSQTILEYVEVHSSKIGTPTMGGIVFLFTTLLVCFIFCRENSFLLFLSLACMIGFAVIGFLDDFIKIKFKRNLGLTPWQKIVGQGGLALIISLFCYFSLYTFETYVPFTLNAFSLGFFIMPIVFIVIIATTNAVNLIDGLDGLATKVTIVYLISFSIILMALADKLYIEGYAIMNIDEIKNLAKGCIALAGSLLAFLVFNSHKALVFMGDVGSLALGGFIACVGVFSGLWLYIPLLGFLYVLTSISVILQVLHFKRTGKRIFLMAPLHHHFEKKGVNEEKIVSLYTIFGIIISTICIYFTV